MSKTAIAALTKAQTILANAGVNVDLVVFMNIGKEMHDRHGRKLWRNADALATLIIDSAANAFQCENSTTFADNYFDNMAEAVERYIDANLEDWDGKSWTNKDSADKLARLIEMVARNVAFEADVAHTEALTMDAKFMGDRCRDAVFFGSLDESQRRTIVEAAHTEALTVNEEAPMYDALSTKELVKRAGDATLAPELRLAAQRELTRRSNLRKDDVSSWKRKLGVGVFLLAGLMLYSHADAASTCPAPTSANSGWVGEDANNDGYTDHIWRVYTSGKCAGQAVDQTDTAEIIASFKPQ